MVDVATSAALLVVVSPIIAIASLAVKIESPGPIFHRSKRVGLVGRQFTMYKLRTMTEGPGPRITRMEDPRVTRVGRWLRRTKLDELPQLINVLRGDMSLVGPRPEDPRFVAQYSLRQRAVLIVRPGMTSAASVLFRNEESLLAGAANVEEQYLISLLPAKLEMDLDYACSHSLRGDMRILAKTVRALVR